MSDIEIVESLKRDLGGKALEIANPDRRRIFLKVAPADLVAAATLLRDRYGLAHLSTITGVDLGESFELLYHFASTAAVLDRADRDPAGPPPRRLHLRRHPGRRPLRARDPGDVRHRRRRHPRRPPPQSAGRLARRPVSAAEGLEARPA